MNVALDRLALSDDEGEENDEDNNDEDEPDEQELPLPQPRFQPASNLVKASVVPTAKRSVSARKNDTEVIVIGGEQTHQSIPAPPHSASRQVKPAVVAEPPQQVRRSATKTSAKKPKPSK